MIQLVVLGKEGGKLKKRTFSCPRQITVASHTQTRKDGVCSSHQWPCEIQDHPSFVGNCKSEFWCQEDSDYPATPFNSRLLLTAKHLQVSEQKLL